MGFTDNLPQRSEYIVGGFNGMQHIVINYNKDGSVVRTINDAVEIYPTRKDFQDACEVAYSKYLEWLENWRK